MEFQLNFHQLIQMKLSKKIYFKKTIKLEGDWSKVQIKTEDLICNKTNNKIIIYQISTQNLFNNPTKSSKTFR